MTASRTGLWRLSVLTCPEADDAVSELLQAIAGVGASSYTDFETQVTRVSIYVNDRRQLPAHKLRKLSQELQALKRLGLHTGPAEISLRRLRSESWKDSWKKHFKVIEIGSRLMIKPSWSRRRPRRDQAVVVLDPGLSFGTGQHPTTAFCLRHLVRFRKPGRAQSCLDIGTGSGILAIAAAKLGYRPVDAFDIDPDSLRVSRSNARVNGVSGRIHFFEQDIASPGPHPGPKYTVVCANLISNLLIQHCKVILSRLAPEGILLLAGILEGQFAAVQRAYEQAGLRLRRSCLQREWRSGSFSWR